MKTKEMRELSVQELENRLNDAREEYMKLRFQMAMGGLQDTSRLSQTRRTIARLLTILRERQAQAEKEGEA
jgi:large subunit ribosomal protein L29